MPSTPQRLLSFCPATIGGIAQYCHEQAKEFATIGLDVTVLCPVDYPYEADGYEQLRILSPQGQKKSSRLGNRLAMVRGIMHDMATLDRVIARKGYRTVLFASYSEYLAPLWAWRFRRHAKKGVIFGSVVHDPVRDYVVGPHWWHKWSVAEAYSFLQQAFLHDAVELDGLPHEKNLPTTVIPHGPFPALPATLSSSEARERYGLPKDAPILIAFGYIRDSKNLDLVIKAMAGSPEYHLVVAGRESTDGQRPVRYYRDLAEKSGVADRCHWFNRFIAADEVGDFFAASDIVILTYSVAFRSASGVLNTAVSYRTPCIASSGEGNLKSTVKRYSLGVFIPPDDPDALEEALSNWKYRGTSPHWESYEFENSWTKNAETVMSALQKN